MAVTGGLGANVIDENCAAGADLSAKQYAFVKINGTANGMAQVVAAGAGDAVYGVLQDKPAASGRVCRVRRSGPTKLLAGGTITAGTHVYLKSDANGKAIATTADGDQYGAQPRVTAANNDTFSAFVVLGIRGA